MKNHRLVIALGVLFTGLSVSGPTIAQDPVSKISFQNESGVAADVGFNEVTNVTHTVNGDVLEISAAGVEFRVKCAVVGESTDETCVVYAGGGAAESDDDQDGVGNSIDECPGTPAGATVDPVGCADSQLDSDGDGVTDNIDQCPNTPAGDTVDPATGCAIYQNPDYCVNTPAGFACTASVNLDSIYVDSANITYVIPKFTALSLPFTTVDTAVARGSFQYENSQSLDDGYNFHAWFSRTPGGAPLTTGSVCELYSNDIGGAYAWSQVSERSACFLGQSGGVFYMNWEVTCDLPNSSCPSSATSTRWNKAFYFGMRRNVTVAP